MLTAHPPPVALDDLDRAIETWKKLADLAWHQESAMRSWRRAWWGNESALGPLAPEYLSQMINPTQVSMFSFFSQMRGAPAAEHNVVTEVASYGSQLGTLLDTVKLLLPPPKERAKLPVEDQCTFRKLERLIEEVERAKRR